MTTLIEQLAELLQAVPDRDGRYHADCPFCGAPGTRFGRPAYHFYVYHLRSGASGAQCWSCGHKGSLVELARVLGADSELPMPAPRPELQRPTPPWEDERWLPGARRHVERTLQQTTQRWQQYRPYGSETVQRHVLMYERLVHWHDERGWYSGKHPRLLIPVMREGRVIGIKGRAVDARDDGPKWLSATGTETWLCGVEDIRRGQEVIWCESLADRILGMQEYPDIAFVATGGLTWRDEWLDRLAAAQPRHVIVWFDHDLSGNGSAHHAADWLHDWQDEIATRRGERAVGPMPTAPTPRGPQLVRELQRRGIRAALYEWPADAPHKADMGNVLMTEIAAKLPA